MGLFSGYRDAHHLKWREAAEYYRTIHVYNLSTVGGILPYLWKRMRANVLCLPG